MKVSQLRGLINEISNAQPDISELDKALKRFDAMELSNFCKMIRDMKSPLSRSVSKSNRRPKTGSSKPIASEVANRVIRLKGDALAFEAELDALGKNRSFTKNDLQDLYTKVFSTSRKLPAKLSKSEMVARFVRQRRRDANFASA